MNVRKEEGGKVCWICKVHFDENYDPLASLDKSNRFAAFERLDASLQKYTLLHYCAKNGHINCLKFIFENESQDINNNSNATGSTALHLAATLNIVIVILKKI